MTTNKPEVIEVCQIGLGTLKNMVLLTDYEALQAENAQLHAAIRRLCNIYRSQHQNKDSAIKALKAYTDLDESIDAAIQELNK